MVKKLVAWVVLLGVVLGALAPTVLAAGDPTQNMPQAPQIANPGEGQERLIAILQRVVNFLWLMAGVVAMIFVAIYGYRIVTNIDPRERAEAMRGVTYALLGVGIIFGSWVIVRVVMGIVLGS